MTGGEEAPLLRLRALSAHASEGARLLDGVGLDLRAGRALAVVGPSGSGKTTLGLAALGLARPAVRLAGQALLNGTDLLGPGLSEEERRAARTGVAAHLPQDPASVLDPVRRIGGVLGRLAAHTGGGAVSAGRRAAGYERARGSRRMPRAERADALRQALEAAGMPEGTALLRRFPHQLSGGQQQRAALATALIVRPRLLVLDEPTSGLDEVTSAALTRRLRDLVARGTALLVLTHDLRLVDALADTTAVLEHGRVTAVADGPAAVATGSAPASRRSLRGAPLRSPVRPARQGGEVRAEGLTVRARGRSTPPLVADFTLSFPPGSRTALVGASGAGKTTFGRALAGLTPASSGRTLLDGRPLPAALPRRDPAQRRAVQYVHQDSRASFDEFRPVCAQLAEAGLRLRGTTPADARAEAYALAGSVGLDSGTLSRRPAALSGGQLQRAALVRALVARPRLLVCDEVTSALDATGTRQVLRALDEAARAGSAVLLITHEAEAVWEWADTVRRVEAGRLSDDGHHRRDR